MKTVVVKNQAEWDALPKAFEEFTVVEIRCSETVTVKHSPESSSVVAWGSSSVVARGSSRVEARGSSRVEAWGSSSVVAWGSSSVVAWGSSRVEAWESSSVEARGSSSVVAWGSSSVVAWGSSRVEARGSSSVVAWESSSVVAWGSSSVVARGSSRVEAWGSSSVVAWESSSVVAWESSSVVARGSVSVHVQSPSADVLIWGFCVAIVLTATHNVIKKSKTAMIQLVKKSQTLAAWMAADGVKAEKLTVTLFKRTSKEFKTQEGTANETTWGIGVELTHPNWNPKQSECGAGKFHACSHAHFCDQYRETAGDRYVAIRVAKKDLHFWKDGEHPHKVAFRQGTVLYECDRFGKKIEGGAS